MLTNPFINKNLVIFVTKYMTKLKSITSPWKVKLPSHMKGISHNSYKSGTTDFGNLTSNFFFVVIIGKLLPLCKSESPEHGWTCFSSRQGAKWYTNKPVTIKLIRKNAPRRKAPHREIVQPLLRPNVVVCASIIARTSRDWVISCVSLEKRHTCAFSVYANYCFA